MQDTFARASTRPSALGQARATIGYLVYKVMVSFGVLVLAMVMVRVGVRVLVRSFQLSFDHKSVNLLYTRLSRDNFYVRSVDGSDRQIKAPTLYPDLNPNHKCNPKTKPNPIVCKIPLLARPSARDDRVSCIIQLTLTLSRNYTYLLKWSYHVM